MPKFVVSVDGYDDVEIVAESKSKARFEAFRKFREAVGSVTFGSFLARGVTVTQRSQ